MRIMTYNIHGCVGGDRKKRPERIIEVIRASGADVVALQEVHNETQGDRSFLEQIYDLEFEHCAFGPTLERDGAEYGNLLLSKYPFEEQQRVDISVPNREPRGAITASIDGPDFTLRLISTHLGLSPKEREQQMHALEPIIDDQAKAYRQGDVHVLMGDINDWRDTGKTIRRCESLYKKAPKLRTFPARLPLFALDRIWGYPGAALDSIYRLDDTIARIASDHRPLIAEITPPHKPAWRRLL